MNALTPLKYSSQTEFDNKFSELSKFLKVRNNKLTRFFLSRQGSSYTVLLCARPNFWKRFCQLIYKPKHLRLSFVIQHLVSFLEANETYLKSQENLEKLVILRSHLFKIRGFNKKVSLNVSNKLQELITRVGVELDKISQKEMTDTVKECEVQAEKRKNNQKESQLKIDTITKETSELVSFSNQSKYIEACYAAFRVQLAKKFKFTITREGDGFRWLSHSLQIKVKGKDKNLFLPSFLFERLEKIVREEKKISENESVILEFPEFSPIVFEEFLELLQGKTTSSRIVPPKFSISLDYHRMVCYYYIACRLFLNEFSVELRKRIAVFTHGYTAMYALHLLCRLPYHPKQKSELAKDQESLENYIFKRLYDDNPLQLNFPLPDVQRIAKFIRTFDCIYADELLDKWAKHGVI